MSYCTPTHRPVVGVHHSWHPPSGSAHLNQCRCGVTTLGNSRLQGPCCCWTKDYKTTVGWILLEGGVCGGRGQGLLHDLGWEWQAGACGLERGQE